MEENDIVCFLVLTVKPNEGQGKNPIFYRKSATGRET
jgi:hypothetical protein